MDKSITRRSALGRLAGATAAFGATAALRGRLAAADSSPTMKLKGNIRHSVCKWCYRNISLDALCKAAKEIGLESIDLLNPVELPTLKPYGLVCAMVNNPVVDGLGGISAAWNRVENHDKLVATYEQRIQQVADAGFPNLICFSGNRAGLADEQGLENCVAGLKRVMPAAEK